MERRTNEVAPSQISNLRSEINPLPVVHQVHHVHQVHQPSIRTVLLPPPQLAPQIFYLTPVFPSPYRCRPLPKPPSPRTFPCIYIGRALSQSPSPSRARPLIFVPLVLDVLAPMPKMAAVPHTPPPSRPGQRKHPGRHRSHAAKPRKPRHASNWSNPLH
jgi:hypothetical protein